MKFSLVLLLFFIITGTISAQVVDDFYDTGKVQEIRIEFREDNWRSLLDSLFIHYKDSVRLLATVTINGNSYRNCGIRYKGYSSWNQNVVKNPFNIDLDYAITNQNYKGHTKIKLSNVIHDPSFVREVIAYETARKYLPASRANYARLFINDALIGLYTNVEAVDKKFANLHYGTTDGSFFKGEPVTLVYPFGENANLADSHGTDSSGYLEYYKNESDLGWNQLLNFIRILNSSPDSLDMVLNVDRVLWMHAFNYTLLNLDSYIGYAQNYYLYSDLNGRFNPILWDLNMSLGSFRESDASTNFLGISIPKLKTLDPLQHMKFSISPRPLMKNLFLNDTLKRMYLAHIRTIVQENLANDRLYNLARDIQAEIGPYVLQDTNRFYSYNDFTLNLESTVGGTGNMLQYPGIHEILEARMDYLSTYPGYLGEPQIGEIQHSPDIPVVGDLLRLSCTVQGASRVFLAYRFRQSAAFRKAIMTDTGTSGDEIAGDGIYSASIQVQGDIIQYYIYAENDTAAAFSPPGAEYRYFTLQPAIRPGKLVINEACQGSFPVLIQDVPADRWLELMNTTSETLNTRGLAISLGEQAQKWNLPDTSIQGGGFLLLIADGAGGDHTGFDLSGSSGKELLLWDASGNKLDAVVMSSRIEKRSLGRYPNGQGSFVYMLPSPGQNNFTGTTPAQGFRAYPNPAHESLYLEFKNTGQPFTVELISMNGQVVMRTDYPSQPGNGDSLGLTLDVSACKGIYLLKFSCNGSSLNRKIMIY